MNLAPQQKFISSILCIFHPFIVQPWEIWAAFDAFFGGPLFSLLSLSGFNSGGIRAVNSGGIRADCQHCSLGGNFWRFPPFSFSSWFCFLSLLKKSWLWVQWCNSENLHSIVPRVFHPQANSIPFSRSIYVLWNLFLHLFFFCCNT